MPVPVNFLLTTLGFTTVVVLAFTFGVSQTREDHVAQDHAEPEVIREVPQTAVAHAPTTVSMSETQGIWIL